MLKCYSSTVQNCIISETDVGWRELIENGQLQQFISLDIWLWSTIGIEHVCKLRVRAPKLISTVPYIAPHPEVSNLILYPIPSTYSTRVLHLFDMAFLYHTGKNTLSSLRKDIKFHKRNWKQADTKPLRRILNPWEETECPGVARLSGAKRWFLWWHQFFLQHQFCVFTFCLHIPTFCLVY